MPATPGDLVLRRATTGDLAVLTALDSQLIEDRNHDKLEVLRHSQRALRFWVRGAASE